MSDVLLTLFQAGWEPMTPLDMGLHLKESAKSGPQVTICFKQKEELATDSAIDVSRVSLDPVMSEHSCLCLETYGSNYLGFHNISNTCLHEIVTSLTCEWPPGLVGVSGGACRCEDSFRLYSWCLVVLVTGEELDLCWLQWRSLSLW